MCARANYGTDVVVVIRRTVVDVRGTNVVVVVEDVRGTVVLVLTTVDVVDGGFFIVVVVVDRRTSVVVVLRATDEEEDEDEDRGTSVVCVVEGAPATRARRTAAFFNVLFAMVLPVASLLATAGPLLD